MRGVTLHRLHVLLSMLS
ncbi:hypothetical protein N7479_010195 [Penicillium vulpinum]|nr:hypothetical protein N7479_010195 [Penicillium vulpinum]